MSARIGGEVKAGGRAPEDDSWAGCARGIATAASARIADMLGAKPKVCDGPCPALHQRPSCGRCAVLTSPAARQTHAVSLIAAIPVPSRFSINGPIQVRCRRSRCSRSSWIPPSATKGPSNGSSPANPNRGICEARDVNLVRPGLSPAIHGRDPRTDRSQHPVTAQTGIHDAPRLRARPRTSSEGLSSTGPQPKRLVEGAPHQCCTSFLQPARPCMSGSLG